MIFMNDVKGLNIVTLYFCFHQKASLAVQDKVIKEKVTNQFFKETKTKTFPIPEFMDFFYILFLFSPPPAPHESQDKEGLIL